MKTFTIHLNITKLSAIPTDAVDKILSSRNSDASMLFLYLIRSGGSLDEETVLTQLGFTQNRMESALSCLIRLGCITETGVTTQATSQQITKTVLPDVSEASYTPQELKRGLECDEHFRWLCSEAESKLGRVLKHHELETLYSIYDYLGMSAEVAVLLIGWLAAQRQSRLDRGLNAPSVSFRQISREANAWCEQGIDTTEKADAHIRNLTLRQSAVGQVLHELGIRDRLPSPGEQRMINGWLDNNLSPALIGKAYDLTVLQKGTLNWPYMRSILNRWLERGYKTVSDMEAGEHKNTKVKPSETHNTNVLDSDYAQRIKAHKARTVNDKFN